MEMNVLGSSSEGNCYLFRARDGETLIVECGIPMREIKRGLGFDISKVSGCLVTHRHKDHARSVAEMCGMGIRVYAPADVFDAVSLSSPFSSRVLPYERFRAGSYGVMAVPAMHDVPCVTYFIHHEEMGWTVFMTDSVSLSAKPKTVSHVMIECNYSDEILGENIERGILHRSQRDRLMVSHCSLSACVGILKRISLAGCRDITLLHLSHSNSDPKLFRQTVEGATGVVTHVAEPGLKVDFTI